MISLRLRLSGLPRIAERGEHAFVFVQILDGRLVGDRQHHLVAAFFSLADLPELRARRSAGQLFVIAIDVLGVSQLAGSAGDAAEEFQRRRHGVRRGHVIHQFRGDARVMQILFDQLGVLFIVLLGAGGGFGPAQASLFGLGKGGRE